MTDYATRLQASNLKATFQRMRIMEVIDQKGHISLDDIYMKIKAHYPSLSLATIYKNILLMTQKGLLVEVPLESQKSKYELAKEAHIHLICRQCGEVEDVNLLESTSQTLQQLTQKESFQLEKEQINLYGVCKACQKRQE